MRYEGPGRGERVRDFDVSMHSNAEQRPEAVAVCLIQASDVLRNKFKAIFVRQGVAISHLP